MKKVEWNSKYKTISVYTVITAFVIICIILFLVNLSYFGDALSAFISILSPFIVGFAAAYLLSRPAAFIEKYLFGFVSLRKPHKALRRGLAILFLFFIVFGILVLIIYFVIPQLIESVALLIKNLPNYLKQIEDAVLSAVKSGGFDTTEAQIQIEEFIKSFLDVTKFFNQFMTRLPTLISSIGTGVLNFFIGMIVCAYVLFSREKFLRQGKKFVYAVFKPEFAHRFLDILKYSNNVFLGYIMGMLISTAFISVSTFVFLTICKMPYAIVITVLVGITNIIPFFGPLLGAIPSAILLLIVDPWYALIFIIFTVILQQIDGNVVLPKAVGMNTGLSAFWVLFALIVGGGLFGFWGLVLGVPIFAVLYSLITARINCSIDKKGIDKRILSTPKDFSDYAPFKIHTNNHKNSDKNGKTSSSDASDK